MMATMRNRRVQPSRKPFKGRSKSCVSDEMSESQ
jgi:hypothetical protein